MKPLIMIVGQTATGKSALAMRLAKHFHGEIIAADSRTVYKDMDIGTAKPTLKDRTAIVHYALDVVRPGEKFTAYDFKMLANSAVDEIAGRGSIPFLVGGTGLYIDAVLYNYSFRPLPETSIRWASLSLGVFELQSKIKEAGLLLPENRSNLRHLQRIFESGMAPRQREENIRPNTLVLGLRAEPKALRERIELRAAGMVREGLIEEVTKLRDMYGNVEVFKTPAYIAASAYIDGSVSIEELEKLCVQGDLQLAKRQRTWFKRNKCVYWLSSKDIFAESVELITTFLNK